jgi:DNA-binding PadR family transcriptional regulator
VIVVAKPSDLIDAIQTFSKHKTKAMRRLLTRTTKENLWLYILNLLEERDFFAYELRKVIKDRFGIEIASVTAYVILYKLERDGLVYLSSERREGRRPTRKYYAITDLGKTTLTQARAYLQILAKALRA